MKNLDNKLKEIVSMDVCMMKYSVCHYILHLIGNPTIPTTYTKLEEICRENFRYRPIDFFCRCFLNNSIDTVLGSCPDTILLQLLNDEYGDFSCEYCSKTIVFSHDDIIRVLKNRNNQQIIDTLPPTPPTK